MFNLKLMFDFNVDDKAMLYIQQSVSESSRQNCILALN